MPRKKKPIDDHEDVGKGKTKVVLTDHVPDLNPRDFGLPPSAPGFSIMTYYRTSGEAIQKAQFICDELKRLHLLLTTNEPQPEPFIESVYNKPMTERAWNLLKSRPAELTQYAEAVKATFALVGKLHCWLVKEKGDADYLESEACGTDAIIIRQSFKRPEDFYKGKLITQI